MLEIKIDATEEWEIQEYLHALDAASALVDRVYEAKERQRWVDFEIYCRTGKFPS